MKSLNIGTIFSLGVEMKSKYIIIAIVIVIPVAFFLLSLGPHEKEDGTIQWQTAFLPEEFYEEKELTSGYLPDTDNWEENMPT